MKPFDPAALDCLAALADTGSFERAARALSITQSAVSQRLRALESHLGRLLVVRARPIRLTEPGKLLLRYARQMHALRADIARDLGADFAHDERLPIAVNADSLATWVPDALNDVVHAGRREGFGLELTVDDQDFTHDGLREGSVLGCVTTVAEVLRGCSMQPLGAMRYVAVASPAFVAEALPKGLHAANFAHVPFIVFNRKDDMQSQWVAKAFGVRGPRLMERFVPSSEASARAAVLGWGIGVMPEQLAAPWLADGALQPVRPEVHLDIHLYWHQWKLRSDEPSGASDRPAPAAVARAGALDRVGLALIEGARAALRPVAG